MLSNHPPNDAFAGATPWSTLVSDDPAQFAGTPWTGSLVGASTEAGEPGTATRTIWYRVDSAAGVLALSDNLAAGLSQALYEGTSVDDLTAVPLITDNSGTVWATLEPGNQYQLQVSASAELAAGGQFYLFRHPSNDPFAGAFLLGPAGTIQPRLLAATREPGEPSPAACASAPKTQWYAITPANASRLDMTLTGPFNPQALATCLTLYQGSSLGGLTQLATATASGGLATIGRNLAAGTTYHIAVAGGSLANPGRDFPTYGLTWSLTGHPPNDDFANATPWTTFVPEDMSSGGGTSWGGTLVGASTEPGEPGSGSRSIWYRIDSTAGSTFAVSHDLGTGLAGTLYEGTSLAGLIVVPFAYDGFGIDWATLQPGHQYHFRVSGDGETAVANKLFFIFPNPSNDAFANARPIGPGGSTGTRLLSATREAGEPSPTDCATAPKTQWFSITPAVASDLSMTLIGPFNSHALATCLTLYAGSSLTGLSQLATATACGALAPISTFLAGGTTYHIAVAGGSLSDPGFDYPLYQLTWTTAPHANHPPSITGATVVVAEDGSVTVDLATSDPDGDPLTDSIDTPPAHGQAAIGTRHDDLLPVTYTPDPNFHGSDTFVVSVTDGEFTASATVNVTVTPANDVPIATTDHATTTVGQAVLIDLVWNDTDIDLDVLGIDSVGQGSFGSVTIIPAAPGRPTSVRFTPNARFAGTDHFSYVVGDGAGGTATGQVDVVVRDVTAPVIVVPADITVTTSAAAGIAVTFAVSATDDVDAAPAVTCVPQSGSIFPLGQTVVT
ncbi:MAG: cadherin-like domain-containing protein, partial [Chloroflexota bacterium]|nr:cadherin-like domain-containing protein [Chloroflexota bacterium]